MDDNTGVTKMLEQRGHGGCGLPAIAAGAILAAALSSTAGVSAGADEMRTWIENAADGSYTHTQYRPAPISAASQPGNSPGRATPRGDEVIWHKYHTDATYTTTGNSIPHGSLVAGTWLNPPMEVELIPLKGDGTPDWVFGGTYFEVAASRNSEVVAAVDFDDIGDVTVYKWHPDSATPDWSYRIEAASPASHRAIVVSPDGSTIAVLVNMQGEREFTRLYYFDPDASEPQGIYELEDGSFGRNIAITDHGQYIAFFATASVYVFDRDAGALRATVSAGAANDALTISGSGEYIAYGWQSLYVRQWNGTTYGLLVTRPGGSEYLRLCTMSSDDSTLAIAWYETNFKQPHLELFELPSSTPLWSYLFEYGTGENQEIVSDLALTANASHLAIASFGDIMNTNPEVHVFQHDSPSPVLTVDTPGSMFDVDIATASDGTVYLAACGKHIHANESGRGGDLYSVLVKMGCPGDFDQDGDVDTADLLYLLGAWGTPDGDMDGDGDTDTADLLALLAAWGDCPRPPCPWDFNGDDIVDDLDRDILMEHWGDCPEPPEECPWDLNGDGVVDGIDLMELMEHYGPCP
jgi:hypothetical protein